MFETSRVVYEHPEYGECYVTFSWTVADGGFWWKPLAVEFDLFCPPHEQQHLIESLLSDQQFRKRLAVALDKSSKSGAKGTGSAAKPLQLGGA